MRVIQLIHLLSDIVKWHEIDLAHSSCVDPDPSTGTMVEHGKPVERIFMGEIFHEAVRGSDLCGCPYLG